MMVRTPQLQEHPPVTAWREENSHLEGHTQVTNGRATNVSDPQIKVACVSDKCWGCVPNTGSRVVSGYLIIKLDVNMLLVLVKKHTP